MVDLPSLFGHTVFCDDIRIERSGKLTLVGAYQSVMFVHGSFPFRLAKFGILISYFEEKDRFTDDIEFRISFPTEDPKGSVVNIRIGAEVRLRGGSESPDKDEWPTAQFHRLDHHVIFAPLVIEKPGVIKVRAYCGDEVAKIGILRIGRSSQAIEAQSDDKKPE